jgi:hypothetical protein
MIYSSTKVSRVIDVSNVLQLRQSISLLLSFLVRLNKSYNQSYCYENEIPN